MRCLALAAGVMVAGCGGEGAAPRNMTRNEVAAEVAGLRVAPGQWEQVREIVSADAPGMPYEVLRDYQQRRTSFRYCITPEQAAEPARISEQIARPNAGCAVSGFRMQDGQMEGRMVCGAGTPREMISAMSGTYAPDRFDYRFQASMAAPGGGTIRLDVRTTGRRIGPCPAGEGGQG